MTTPRTRIVALAVAVLLGVAASTVAAAGALGGASPNRTEARADAPSAVKPGKRTFERAERVAQLRRACRLGCVKRKLAKLTRKHNQLAGQFNALAADYYGCEQLAPITQYFGYQFDNGGGVFDTTAIDYTDPGDTPDDLMVVYVC